MELIGTIESIVFRNAENGYTVAHVSTPKRVTCVGIFPPITEGERVVMTGEMVVNRNFGEQFKATSVQVSPPTGRESMIKYLSGGLFKGIGEVTAKNIVSYFGDKTFEVIEFMPAELVKVRGISRAKAESIGEQYSSFRAMQNTIIFLQSYEISLNLALKIYKTYEGLTEQVIRSNPFRLIEDVDGVGFATADMLALSMGIEKDSTFRISAAVVHVLKSAASTKGHTYLPSSMLLRETMKLLAFDEDRTQSVLAVLDEMQLEGTIVYLNDLRMNGVMLKTYYNLERSISKNLFRLMETSIDLDLDLEEEIAAFEKKQGVTLHAGQKEAVTAAVNSGCVIITGGPGTGKTTIIKCIIELLQNKGYSFALTAPTGRAAKRMSEATGAEAKTIHRLLDLRAGNYSSDVKIDAEVIIVDEISMADEYVFNALLRAVPVGGKLILVGDKDQLPSVGAGNILADVISSGKVPVKYLTHIYRQSADSHIALFAHMINGGSVPEFDNKSRDFFFDNVPESGDIVKDVISLCTERLPKYFKLDPSEVQVLAPLKKGDAGVEELNAELQKVVNAPALEKRELMHGGRIFREGDRVIHMVNNYHLGWVLRKEVGFEIGEGVFNGDIGKVIEVDRAEAELKVQFEDGKVATYTAGDLDELALAYAISVHKSQGSEFPVAVVAFSRYNPIVTSRNLLYTAITRAKRAVVLVGDKQNVIKMIKNNYTEKRHTALARFLTEGYEA
ncbi:MAG: ATP-dependent RecD-like DNA helicase [Clostridia bacterium]|nr:ATP-dependent RecD-like DNA helicase [Clostridia bacterium]